MALLVPATAVLAGRAGDQRFLKRILRVDGTGSGLDADTVRGLTPEQMKGSAGPAITRAALYAHARRATLQAGEEQHLYADCDDPRDIALSCAGGAISGATESPISWMGVVPGDGAETVDRCLVVVYAGSSAPQTEIEAQVRCLLAR